MPAAGQQVDEKKTIDERPDDKHFEVALIERIFIIITPEILTWTKLTLVDTTVKLMLAHCKQAGPPTWQSRERRCAGGRHKAVWRR